MKTFVMKILRLVESTAVVTTDTPERALDAAKKGNLSEEEFRNTVQDVKILAEV